MEADPGRHEMLKQIFSRITFCPITITVVKVFATAKRMNIKNDVLNQQHHQPKKHYLVVHTHHVVGVQIIV